MNIIKGVIALVIGMVLAIIDRASTRATVGSAANIGSFAGAGSINDLIPLPAPLVPAISPVPTVVVWATITQKQLRSSTMPNPEGRILTIIPCHYPLTTVELLWDGPGQSYSIAHYAPIVAIMYRYPPIEKQIMKWGNERLAPEGEVWWLPPSVEYSTDYERFHSHPGTHQTTEDGGCECISRRWTGVSRVDRKLCHLFGMFNRTPEELKADPQLTEDIFFRIAYVEAIRRAEEQKEIMKKERGRIYNQRAKEKRLAKQAEAAGAVPA
jgi:hypothetical protein